MIGPWASVQRIILALHGTTPACYPIPMASL
jgi:hypothetical protein